MNTGLTKLSKLTVNPLKPWRKTVLFYKMMTVDQKTMSNIPVGRYCFGYVVSHQNRHTRCHKLNWGIWKVKKWKRSKIPYSLYILGIPPNHNLIYSFGCEDFKQIFNWLKKCQAQKFQKTWGVVNQVKFRRGYDFMLPM